VARRILIYTNHFFPENFKVNEVADWLAEKYEVLVVTGIPNYPSGIFYENYGLFKNNRLKHGKVNVMRLPLIPRGSGSKFRLVLNYLSYFLSAVFYTVFIALQKRRFDTLIVHHTSPISIALPPIIYKFFRQPRMILWDLDMWPDTLKAMGMIKSPLMLQATEKAVTWIYKKYDYVLVGSKSFESKARKRTHPDRVHYFPNWAEQVFQDQHFVIPSQEPYIPVGFNIMYAGNIGEAQDFENVYRAIEILKGEDINWLFVGDGRNRKQFENRLEKANLLSKVYFFGSYNVKYMPYFFDKASVLFFSLKNEEIFSKTVPAKLQAYMTSGRPIVGMISGEGAAIINQAKCGVAVDSGDFSSLASTILNLRKMEPGELRILGRNGKSYYELNFSSANRKNELLKLIDQ